MTVLAEAEANVTSKSKDLRSNCNKCVYPPPFCPLPLLLEKRYPIEPQVTPTPTYTIAYLARFPRLPTERLGEVLPCTCATDEMGESKGAMRAGGATLGRDRVETCLGCTLSYDRSID